MLNCVQLFVTPWTAAHQTSLSFTISQSLLKLTSIELVMPSNLSHPLSPLLLLPSIFPSIRVFSSESALHISGKEHACNAGDTGLIPGLGRSPGGRHGNPLQYSCWENPMERGACQAMGPWDHKESDMTEVTEHRKIDKQLW